MLCTALDTFRIAAYSALCFFRYIHACSIIFRVTEAYSPIRHIQVHSGKFNTLCNPRILTTLFKTLWNVDQAYSEPCYRTLFNHIQAYSEPCTTLAYTKTWHTQNPGIFRTLSYLHPHTYSERCHINENLRLFRTLIYLKSSTYSEPSQRLTMEFFAKIVKNYNYFSKLIHLRSLTGFWIRLSLSLNKYLLTCSVTSRYVLYHAYI